MVIRRRVLLSAGFITGGSTALPFLPGLCIAGYAQVPFPAELLAAFDGKLFSGLLGLVKPDRAIFRKL